VCQLSAGHRPPLCYLSTMTLVVDITDWLVVLGRQERQSN
jgi:hypothetical protein